MSKNLILIGSLLFAAFGVYHFIERMPDSTIPLMIYGNTFHVEKPPYVFSLPATYLGCVRYRMHDGEHFDGWHIEQPMSLSVGEHVSRPVWITNNHFRVDAWCRADAVSDPIRVQGRAGARGAAAGGDGGCTMTERFEPPLFGVSPAMTALGLTGPRVDCSECKGRGLIKLWSPGKPHTICMARCEQCSGFGKVAK